MADARAAANGMLPSGVRRRVALLAGVAGLAAGGAAHADDPRDTFGFGKKPAEPAPTCEDGLAFGCVTATDPLDDKSPYALRTWLPSSYLLKLPVGDARHDQVAHWATGAGRDEAGPYFGGASGLENRWTIEGAPADGVRTGNVDTRVPLTFMEGMLVVAGGFAARDRASTGGTIDVTLRRGGASHVLDSHAWTGFSAEGRSRPIADGTYSPRRLRVSSGPEASLSVVATGPVGALAGGRVWYAAGVAPSLAYTDFAWRTGRLVDDDGDGNPDGNPGPVETRGIVAEPSARTLDYLVPMMARVGWERGPHEIDLTLIGHAGRNTSFLSQATLQAGGVDHASLVGDGIATWRGTWKHTRARVQLSWHRSVVREAAHDPAAAGRSQLLTTYIPTMLDEEPALAAACNDLDPDDPLPTIPNCPVPVSFFASGGAGLLVDSVGDRPTATAEIAHRRGDHVLRAGGTFEDTRLVNTSSFTGGELIRSLFEGHTDRARFFEGPCPEHGIAEPKPDCGYVTTQALNYRTRYTAAYLEDTFEVAPRIRVNGGVRWELMWVGPRLHFSDQIAPRLGIAWDVLGEGRSRLWTSMGRSFVMIPAGTGSTVIARNRVVRDIVSPFGETRSTNGGSAYRIAPGIQPAAQDEVTLGLEAGLTRMIRAGVWIQGRWLRRGLETVLVNPETFEAQFDNPGRHGDTPARRDATVIAAEVMMMPSDKMTVRASYLYGETTGSWAGSFDPRQGGVLFGGSDWDADARNLHGRLPTDPGHRAFVEAERRGALGGLELSAATRLTVASGRPRNILADTDVGLIYLLPRGSVGRGPVLSQANVRLAARWRGTDFTLDLFNVFDRTEATNLDEVYASGGTIQPIRGGTRADLVFAKDEVTSVPQASPVTRRSAYGLPIAFQSPFALTFGIHHAF